MGLQAYVDTMKSGALTIGEDAVMTYIVGAAPFFGLPVIRQITQVIVSQVLNIAINKTEMGSFFLYIDLRTNQQGKDFALAAAQNHLAQLAGSEKEKADAKANLKNSFRALADFTD